MLYLAFLGLLCINQISATCPTSTICADRIDSQICCEAEACVWNGPEQCVDAPVTPAPPGICPKQKRVCDRPGECCSEWGWCGTTDVHCDNPYDFGTCPTCPVCSFDCDECEDQPTPPPTPPPTTPPLFEEHCNCNIYGDPHWKMWNCDTHSWQGPHGSVTPGDVFAMTRCDAVEHKNIMPFDLIASIQRCTNHFTSLDYTILRLWDGNDEGTVGTEYCIKNKGDDGVTYNEDCSDTYMDAPNELELGEKFNIMWHFENGYSKLYLDILDSGCVIDLTIITHSATNIHGEREEFTQIGVSECYKAFTCGMCGNFRNTGLEFELSDGSTTTLDAGAWGGTANDANGLSYFVDPPDRRRLQTDEEIAVEPCFGLREELENECKSQFKSYAQCCWDRSDFCDDLITTCSWDTCACIMSQGEQNYNISQCVASIVENSMSFVCGLEADSFFQPDMSIYDSDSDTNYDDDKDEGMCEDCDAAQYVFIGIISACAVFVVIGGLLYFLVIKPALSMAKVRVNSGDFVDVEVTPTGVSGRNI